MKKMFAVGSSCRKEEKGLYLCELDPDSKKICILAYASGIADPSWLEYDQDRNLIYTGGTEDEKGIIAVYQIEIENGSRPVLNLRGIFPVSGGASCHQALDPKKEFLSVSFYETGSLSLVRLDKNGIPLEETCHLVHTGHSVHPKRQQEAHVHFSQFIGDDLYCCDLGEDRIYEYHLNRKEGTLEDTGKQIRTIPGDGPRHFVYNPRQDFLYVVTEMGGNVSAFNRKNGQLLQRIDSIPEEVDRSSLPVIDYDAFGAAIHWYGINRILVSNRGHDSITIFEVLENGLLERIFNRTINGRIPRDFNILEVPADSSGNNTTGTDTNSELYIVSANQTSNDLTVMKLSPDCTSFSDTGIRVTVSSPTRILPLQI